jgi:hypothetical protein
VPEEQNKEIKPVERTRPVSLERFAAKIVLEILSILFIP